MKEKEAIAQDELVQEKQKEVEDQTQDTKEESKVMMPGKDEELKQYRFADTVISCRSCGRQTNISHPEFINVEVGLQLPTLFTTNKHCLALACSHCGQEGVERISEESALTLHMVEAVHPPAHNFTYENTYDVPLNATVEWKAGDNVKEYEVLLKDLDKDLKEGEENEFEEISKVSNPKIELDLKGNNSYELLINTVYNTDDVNPLTVPNKPVFISTKQKPSESKEETKQEESKE